MENVITRIISGVVVTVFVFVLSIACIIGIIWVFFHYVDIKELIIGLINKVLE